MKTKILLEKSFLFIVALFFSVIVELNAQDPANLTSQDFSSIMLNDQMLLTDLIGIDGDYNHLKNELGQPLAEECNNDMVVLGMEPSCTFLYPGLEILYTDVGNGPELAEAIISGPGSHLTYQGVEIRVGDPVSKLQTLFPEAYSLRGPVTHGGVTRYYVQLNVAGSVTNLSFRYNNTTQTIAEIILLRIIT